MADVVTGDLDRLAPPGDLEDGRLLAWAQHLRHKGEPLSGTALVMDAPAADPLPYAVWTAYTRDGAWICADGGYYESLPQAWEVFVHRAAIPLLAIEPALRWDRTRAARQPTGDADRAHEGDRVAFSLDGDHVATGTVFRVIPKRGGTLVSIHREPSLATYTRLADKVAVIERARCDECGNPGPGLTSVTIPIVDETIPAHDPESESYDEDADPGGLTAVINVCTSCRNATRPHEVTS